jgi:hypothetical protein
MEWRQNNMAEEESRLLRDWHNEKGDIEGFLADPLKWVADELKKACANLSLRQPPSRDLKETIEALIDIIRFINAHRNLLTTN